MRNGFRSSGCRGIVSHGRIIDIGIYGRRAVGGRSSSRHSRIRMSSTDTRARTMM
jgi:hypothetical protein